MNPVESSAFAPPTQKPAIGLGDVCEEPFRLFFPLAVLAGLLGVSVWPLHFGGFIADYPGAGHARLMANGFFGGFMLGFLGTAWPRLTSTPPLRLMQVGGLFVMFLMAQAAYFMAALRVGDGLFLLLLACLTLLLGLKFLERKDVPPPGFVLLPLAVACAAGGAVISLLEAWYELPAFWLVLRPLLAFQGFVLLPILGVGAFILPRCLGMENCHAFPASRTPPPGWWPLAGVASAVGLGVVLSFFIEAAGHHRMAYWLRFACVGGYLFRFVPALRSRSRGRGISLSLRVGLVTLPLGFLAVAIWPVQRVALLHIVLVGGLAVITLAIAARVVFNHSGQRHLLHRSRRWLAVALILMLLGMVSRISGDFLPRILVTHYNYGALCWGLGVLLWAGWVLPSVLVADSEK